MTGTSPPTPEHRREQRESPEPPPTDWRPRWWVELTTIVSFVAGLAGFVNELLSGHDRPAFLAASVSLMSGAAVLRAVERRR